MKLVALKECQIEESRVALTPTTAQKYIDLDIEVFIESGAGEQAYFSDNDYKNVGVKVFKDRREVKGRMDILLKVQPPFDEDDIQDTSVLKKGGLILSTLDPFDDAEKLKIFCKKKLTTFALELLPNFTRTQAMDIMSSQAHLSGYKAVIDAASTFSKSLSMMTTSAGTIMPAKVLIIGAGTAGLQAISTAKRLGATVSAYDIRQSRKNQVESLGAKFISIEGAPLEESFSDDDNENGLSNEFKKLQNKKLHEAVKSHDIVICSALVANEKAPILITEEMIKDMNPGSIIVDLAIDYGGNVELSKMGTVRQQYDVIIIGYSNYPSRICVDASELFSNNLYNMFAFIYDTDSQKLNIKMNDHVIQATLITHAGKIIHQKVLHALEKHKKDRKEHSFLSEEEIFAFPQ